MQTSTMIKATARSAPDREKEINSLVQNAHFENDAYLKEFGISINTQMQEVKGRILEPPKIQFGGNSRLTVMPQLGVWDMRGKQFHTGIEIHTWAIACFTPPKTCNETALRVFTQQLQRISTDAGMPIVGQPCFCKYASDVQQVEQIFRYLKERYQSIQLVLIILPGKTPVYGNHSLTH